MQEVVVAVFDAQERAHWAMDSLGATGVAESAMRCYAAGDPRIAAWISAHPAQAADVGGSSTTRGFWASLFGADSRAAEHHVYDRSLRTGSVVLAVDIDGHVASRVIRLLECHLCADIGERAAQWGLGVEDGARELEATGEEVPLHPDAGTRIRRYAVAQPVRSLQPAAAQAATAPAGQASAGREVLLADA